MKKISYFALTLILSLSIVNPCLFGQVPLATPGIVPTNLEKIGVVAATQGIVEITSPGQIGRVAESGQAVFLGDEVKTDAQGHLQILLLDQTVFTIGPSSAIIIDEFVYDPKTSDGKMQASITKGIFRYVSGKIAAKKPNNVTIKLPSATIGIRGTIIAGEAGTNRSFAMLLGPGENNNAKATIGSFNIQGIGAHSGDQQQVNRTGFGVQVDQNGGLSGVFKVPDSEMNRLTQGLVPSQGQAPGQGPGQGQNPNQGLGQHQPVAPRLPLGMQPLQGPPPQKPLLVGMSSATQMSGQGTFLTLENSNDTGFVEILTQITNSDKLADASLLIAEPGVLGPRATWDDLRKIQPAAGIFHFQQNNVPLIQAGMSVGYYNIQYEINFGTRQVGTGSSYISGTVELSASPTNFSFSNLPQVGFNNLNGMASIPFSATDSGSGISGQGVINITNSPGSGSLPINNIATGADHSLTVTDGTESASGSGHAGRQPGPA